MANDLARGVSGALALVGGSLMVFSGFSTHSLFLSVVVSMTEGTHSQVPALLLSVLGVVSPVVNAVLSLGGSLVVLGGVLVIRRHMTSGRLLIALGGGVGFLGLLVAASYYVITVGVSVLLTHVEYWLGVLLAAMARWLAAKA